MASHESRPALTPPTQGRAGCLGAIAGMTLGFFLAAAFGEMEGIIFLGVVLPPPLALVGAACGTKAARFGWAAAMPLALSVGGGFVATFAVTIPFGPAAVGVIGACWVAGGVLGGLLKGAATGSVTQTVVDAAEGAVQGFVGSVLCLAYVACVAAACRVMRGG